MSEELERVGPYDQVGLCQLAQDPARLPSLAAQGSTHRRHLLVEICKRDRVPAPQHGFNVGAVEEGGEGDVVGPGLVFHSLEVRMQLVARDEEVLAAVERHGVEGGDATVEAVGS